MSQNDLVSIIVPVRNEERNVQLLYDRICDVMSSMSTPWEIIFVEDSSQDGTVNEIRHLAATDDRVRAILLTRGFGHHAAISAGLDYATGERIITMDGDLQHPPEFLPQMMECYEGGYDMVCARPGNKRATFKKLGSKALNNLMSWLTDEPIDLQSSGFRVFSKAVARTIKAMPERRRFMSGMLSWSGYRCGYVVYEEHEREYGETKYGFLNMIELAATAITSFSVKPLRIGIYLGFLSATFSIAIAFYYITRYLTADVEVPGFTATIVAIFFMGGLNLLVLGIVGEYLANVFIEVKARPLYVVRDLMNLERNELQPENDVR